MGDEAKSTKDDQASRPIQPTIAFGSGQDTSPQAEASGASAPKEFGRYRILRTLGEGAMGSVHLAHDTQLDRKVALKIPKFSESSDPTIIDRFYKEARSAATLDHPNICSVFDVGEIAGIHYIAMAYIQGQSLAEFVNPAAPPSPRSIARVVRKIALALQDAHTHGVIHRDLKPANVMVDQRKEPIVMDFGLARQAQQSDDSRLTQAGVIVGTPAYMSPEQLEGSPDKIGPACDIYSLGVLLYELLTGELPFPGSGSVVSIIGEVFSKPPPNATEKRHDLDQQLAEICIKAMAKKPEERFDSMKAFAAELALFLTKKKGAKKKPSVSTGSATPTAIRIQEQRKLVQSLCQEKQFAAASTILEKIAATKDPAAAESAAWARQELPVVQNLARAEAPGIDLADEASLFDDDLLTSGETAAASSFDMPTAARSDADRQAFPKWLLWAIPIPVAVLLLLFGFMFISSWLAPGDANDVAVDNAEPTIDTTEPPAVDATDDLASNDSPNVDAESDPPRRLAALLKALDADGNGELSFFEIPRRDTIHFVFVDLNNDHSLNAEELKTYLRVGRSVDDRASVVKKIVEREMVRDTNEDGELSLTELPPYFGHLVPRVDLNRNSMLDKEELSNLVTESLSGGPGREQAGKPPRNTPFPKPPGIGPFRPRE